jgi:bacteriocin-like protein
MGLIVHSQQAVRKDKFMNIKHDNSNELTTDQLVSSTEKDVEQKTLTLSDDELAEVYGGGFCCFRRRHHHRRRYYCCCY